GLVEGEVAYAVLPPWKASLLTGDPDAALRSWKTDLPHRPAGGALLGRLWELVDCNGEQITRDWQGRRGPRSARAGVITVGPEHRLSVAESARVDPLVVADTTNGPVVIAEGAVVHAFSRLEGPCYIGPGSQVLGAKIRAGTSLGPECRIGGEV